MWKTKDKTQVHQNQEDNWKPYLLLINSTLDVMGGLYEQLELSGWLRTSRSWGTWMCRGSGHQLTPTRSISDTTRQPPVPTTLHQPSESKNCGCCWSTSSSGVTQSLISTESSDTYLRPAFVSVTQHSTEEHRREQKILATSHEKEGCFLQRLFPLCTYTTALDHHVLIKCIFQWFCGQKSESHWWSLSSRLHPGGPLWSLFLSPMGLFGTFTLLLNSPLNPHAPQRPSLHFFFLFVVPLCSFGGNGISDWISLKPQQKYFFLLLFLLQAQHSPLDSRIGKAWDILAKMLLPKSYAWTSNF